MDVPGAATISALDHAGSELPLTRSTRTIRSRGPSARLTDGKSGILTTSDAATTLVVRDAAGRDLIQLPMALQPDQITVIRN